MKDWVEDFKNLIGWGEVGFELYPTRKFSVQQKEAFELGVNGRV